MLFSFRSAGAFALTLLSLAPDAFAQTPAAVPSPALPPKVCVAAAGDAEPVVVRAAEALLSAIDARTELRSVVDPDLRGVLLGRRSEDPSLQPIFGWRRALSAASSTAAAEGIVERMGCTHVLAVVAQPEGLVVRTFVASNHRFDEGRAYVEGQAPSLLQMILTRPTVAPTSTSPQNSQANRTSTTVVPTATATQATQLTPREQRSGERSVGPWPWIIAGGAAAVLLGVFVVTQVTGPSTPVLQVNYPGSMR